MAAPKQDFNPCPAAVPLGVSQHRNSASCPSWLSKNYVLPVSPDHAKCKGKSQLHFRQIPGFFRAVAVICFFGRLTSLIFT